MSYWRWYLATLLFVGSAKLPVFQSVILILLVPETHQTVSEMILTIVPVHSLAPPSLKLRCPANTSKARDIIKRDEKRLIRERIRVVNNKIKNLSAEKEQLSDRFYGEIPAEPELKQRVENTSRLWERLRIKTLDITYRCCRIWHKKSPLKQ